MSVGPGHHAVLGALVLAIGLYGLLSRRDAPGLLLAGAVALLGPVLALSGLAETGVGGQGAALALIILAAAGAQLLVGSGLLSLVRRRHETLDTEQLTDLDA